MVTVVAMEGEREGRDVLLSPFPSAGPKDTARSVADWLARVRDMNACACRIRRRIERVVYNGVGSSASNPGIAEFQDQQLSA